MNQSDERIQLFIAGDSTASNYPPQQAPMAGWGQLLHLFFSDRVDIRNEARCGRSSKSFIMEGHVQRIWEHIRPNDYLFIQFGHNDEKPHGTEPYSSYQDYLTQYIEGARSRSAYPVLLTPVQRRFFDITGQLKQTHGDYPAAMKQLAAQLEVPLLDLCSRTEQLYESYGPELSKQLFVWLQPEEHPNYLKGVEDNTHFNEKGAFEVAKLAAEEMVAVDLPIARYVKWGNC